MENMNWAVIIAAVITLSGALITIFKSAKIQTSIAKMNEQLTTSQIKTQDKQRIVGNIGNQRIEWVNKIRDIFIDYNDNSHHLGFYTYKATDKKIADNLSEIKRLSFDMNKSIHTVELLLNPTEPYTKFLINTMLEMNNLIREPNYELEKYKMLKKRIMFSQNVILKAEWKRIKDETERGEFLSDREIEKIFDSVGSNMDKEIHNLIMGKYRNLD